MRLLKFVTLFVVVACLVTPAIAQNDGCKAFHGVLQATLDVTPGTGLGWTGTLRGFLDNNIPLVGYLIGGGLADTVQHGQTGHEPLTYFIIDFGAKGKLVTIPDKGIFPVSPQVAPHMVYPPETMFGAYYSTPKVAPNVTLGTSGWFLNATGNLTFNGTFLVDNASIVANGTLTNIGAWNSEVNGRLCNVQP